MAPDPDGSTLRAELESALEREKRLIAENRTYKVRDLIADKGYDLVSPEDLAEVPDKDLESRAAEIQESKRSIQVQALVRAGHSEEEATKILEGGTPPEPKPKPNTPDPEGKKRAQAAASSGSGNVPPKIDTSGLVGIQKIDAHFAGQE